jgi:hypothetical protein
VRDATGWTDFQVRTHLEKLVALEYVLVHRGARGQSFVYELCYDGKGQDGAPFVVGLVDVETLGGHSYDSNIEHRNGKVEAPSSPHRASNQSPSRMGREAPLSDGGSAGNAADPPKRAHNAHGANGRSYAQPVA